MYFEVGLKYFYCGRCSLEFDARNLVPCFDGSLLGRLGGAVSEFGSSNQKFASTLLLFDSKEEEKILVNAFFFFISLAELVYSLARERL